ncbi:hypothetical protein KIPB_000560, partial [Kipferlia bialata]
PQYSTLRVKVNKSVLQEPYSLKLHYHSFHASDDNWSVRGFPQPHNIGEPTAISTHGGAYLVRHCCDNHCDIVDMVLQSDSPDQLAVCLKDASGREWWSSNDGQNWHINKFTQTGWSPKRGLCFPSFHRNQASLSTLVVCNHTGGASVSLVYKAYRPGSETTLTHPTPECPVPQGWHKADLVKRADGVYGGGLRWRRDTLTERGGVTLAMAYVMKDEEGTHLLSNEGDLYWPLSVDTERGIGGEIRNSYGFRKSGFRADELCDMEVEGETGTEKGGVHQVDKAPAGKGIAAFGF